MQAELPGHVMQAEVPGAPRPRHDVRDRQGAPCGWGVPGADRQRMRRQALPRIAV